MFQSRAWLGMLLTAKIGFSVACGLVVVIVLLSHRENSNQTGYILFYFFLKPNSVHAGKKVINSFYEHVIPKSILIKECKINFYLFQNLLQHQIDKKSPTFGNVKCKNICTLLQQLQKINAHYSNIYIRNTIILFHPNYFNLTK